MQTLFYRLLNISAKYHQNRSLRFWAIFYTVSKLGRFWRRSVYVTCIQPLCCKYTIYLGVKVLHPVDLSICLTSAYTI